MAADKGRPFRGRCGVGLDLSGDGLQAVCVTRSAEGAAAVLSPEAMAALLRDNGRCVVAVSMSIAQSICVSLELPFEDERRARRVLPSLLDIQLPFALEEAAYCFPAVLEAGPTALAVVARHPDVNALLEGVRAHQADPQILDHEGLALWSGGLRWHQQAHGGIPAELLVVSIAAGRVVLVHGREGRYRTALECQATDRATLTRLLSTLLGPRAQRAAGGASTTRILVCGSGVDQADDAMAVIEQWGLPLSRPPEPATFLPEALARRALQGDGQPYPCNLRVAEHAHRGTARQGRRSLLVAAGLCWLMAVLLVGGSLTTSLVLAQRSERLARQLDTELDRTAGFNISAKGAAARQQALTAVAEERTRYAAVTRQFEPGLQRYFWQVLAQAHGAGLVVSAYSLNENGLLRLEGRVGEGGRLAVLEQWLQASGWSVESAGAVLPEVRLVATPLVNEGGTP